MNVPNKYRDVLIELVRDRLNAPQQSRSASDLSEILDYLTALPENLKPEPVWVPVEGLHVIGSGYALCELMRIAYSDDAAPGEDTTNWYEPVYEYKDND